MVYFQKKLKGIVFIKWLMSYFIILLLPILISGVLIYRISKTTRHELNRANEAVLVQLQQSIDTRLDELNQISLDLVLNPRIARFLRTDSYNTSDGRYATIEIKNDIRSYMNSNPYIADIYVYDAKMDLLINSTSTATLQDIYKKIGLDNGQTEDDFRKFLFTPKKNFFNINYHDSMGNTFKTLAHTRILGIGNPNEPQAVAIFIVDISKIIDSVVKTTTPIETSTILIMDENDNVIASSNKKSYPLTYGEMVGSIGFLTKKIDSHPFDFGYIRSKSVGWTYIIASSVGTFFGNMNNIYWMVGFGAVLCLVAGYSFALLFSKINYTPLNDIVSTILASTGKKNLKFDDEYFFIKESIASIITEKQGLLQQLDNNTHVLLRRYLAKLLMGNEDAFSSYEKSKEAFQIDFNTNLFAVIVFHIDGFTQNTTNISVETQNKWIELVLHNVVEELVRKKNQGYVVEMDRMYVCIVNIKQENLDIWQEQLLDVVQTSKTFMQNNFNIYSTPAISNLCRDLREICQSYREAQEVLEYKLISGNENIFFRNEITKKEYDFAIMDNSLHIQLQQKIALALHEGNFEELILIFEDLFAEKTISNASVVSIRLLISDVVNTVFRAIFEMNSQIQSYFFETLNCIEELTQCQTVPSVKNKLLLFMEQACQYIHQLKSQQKDDLKEQILAYLQENYADINLSVSSLAAYFNISSSYLSKQFRQQNGEGILNVIGKIRIQKAKELLEKDLFIQDVSQKVGYADINTFIRIFKKNEGITPGKYKELKTKKS